MEHKVIHLCPEDEKVTLTSYIPTTREKNCDALLIIPGGGYYNVCSDREGESIAITFAAMGMKCFWLNYSTEDRAKERTKFPGPLMEASMAMVYIKEHAEEYGINPDRVFVLGFSAGGHLAASLGTLWHLPIITETLNIPYGANRPCGMVLCYPVISYFPETHLSSFYKALGTTTPTEEETASISLDKRVDEKTVPAFMWHTADDPAVHVDNTLKMMSALARNKIYCEAHIYPHGPHGMGLGTKTTADTEDFIDQRIAKWPQLAREWMNTL